MAHPDFDSIKHLNPYNVEYWEARELMPLLGYKSWREFEGAIERAKTVCKATGNITDDHFVSGYKMVQVGSGAQRRISDYTLSRLACYLIAMNGNPRLPQIAEAQQYFAGPPVLRKYTRSGKSKRNGYKFACRWLKKTRIYQRPQRRLVFVLSPSASSMTLAIWDSTRWTPKISACIRASPRAARY